jgi:hypothetical protein
MKGQKFQEAGQLIASAISLDPTCAYVPKAEVALRDALTGIGVPAKWMNSESDRAAEEGRSAGEGRCGVTACGHCSRALRWRRTWGSPAWCPPLRRKGALR